MTDWPSVIIIGITWILAITAAIVLSKAQYDSSGGGTRTFGTSYQRWITPYTTGTYDTNKVTAAVVMLWFIVVLSTVALISVIVKKQNIYNKIGTRFVKTST